MGLTYLAAISGPTAVLIVMGLLTVAAVAGVVLKSLRDKRKEEVLANTIPVDGLKVIDDETENEHDTDPIMEPSVPVAKTPDVATQRAPSCLALGVAHSIRETPEYWVIDGGSDDVLSCSSWPYSAVNLNVRHHVIGTRLCGGIYLYLITGNPSPYLNWISINGNCLDSIDAKPIIDAIMSNPIGQFKERLARKAEQKAIADRTESYFSHLGCPPDEDGTKDIRNVL